MPGSAYIKKLIAQGESQTLDFKYNVSSAAKIAKTLVAFANTDGGRLLIGVKDNGRVIGIESEEEIYMIELAADRYCDPPVRVKTESHEVEGRIVLEAYVAPSDQKPHLAKDETGKWCAFVRRADENLLADKVLVEVFKRRREGARIKISYDKPERFLLEYLQKHPSITFRQFCDIAKLPPQLAEKILINMASVGIIQVHVTPTGNFFTLNAERKA